MARLIPVCESGYCSTGTRQIQDKYRTSARQVLMLRNVLSGLGILLLGLVATLFWTYGEVISTVSVDQKVVALTYDDGPNPPHTQAMLDLLAEKNVSATFFPKARNVEAFPGDLRAIAAAGHEIGNHSYDHYAMSSFSVDDMRGEVERANRVLHDVLGVTPVLFRPPYGAQGVGLKRALAQLNMTSVGMSAHGSDWELTEAAEIAAAILEKVEPGGIILLHDGHADVADPMAQETRAGSVEATRIVIDTLRQQGYSFVTVGELLKLKARG